MLHTSGMDETNSTRHQNNKEPTFIHCDNTSVISLSKNPVQHSKSKHIPIKYHYLRDQAENKNIKLEYVPTQDDLKMKKT